MNRKVLLIAAAGAVALVAAWFVLLWSPQSSRLDGAHEREEQAADANSALELRIDRLRDLRARRPELEADLVALQAAVPGSPQLDGFLLDADTAAERAGVDITSITPSKPSAGAAAEAAASTTTTTAAAGTTGTTGTTGDAAAAGTAPSAITVALDATGGYFQVLDFINRLDDLPRVVVVDSLTLASGGGAGGEGDATATAAPATTGSSQLTMSISARMFTTAPAAAEDGTGVTTTTTTAGGSGQ